MANIAIAITPTQAQIGAGKFAIPATGIDSTKIDLVKFMQALYNIKTQFAGGTIKSSADSVVLTVTIDGTRT